MDNSFNKRIIQLLLLLVIILLVILSVIELKLFMPGILGAITLYILSRAKYFQLIYSRKWRKGWTAGLFIFFYLILLGIPIMLAATLITPKVNIILNDPTGVIDSVKSAVAQVQQKAGITFFSQITLTNYLDAAIGFIPSIVNSTIALVTNLIIMLFFLYYMLFHCSTMEKSLSKLIPLKDENTTMLATETKKVVKANALGIPLISIIQGATATIGYLIFGVNDFAIWGFLTGVFAFFPVVGTMIVWIPLVIYMYANEYTFAATGLLIYSIIVTGNVDYIARITIMKRMGDVHPVVTVLGVIIGLGLFGFIGLVFGPLLVNYIIVLTNIYRNEFSINTTNENIAAEKAAT